VNTLFSAKRTEVAAILYRIGHEVTIRRYDENAAVNQYGKVSDTDRTYSDLTTEYARRVYNSNTDRDSQQLVQGGRLSEDTPRIAFTHDTAAEADDRVVFPDGQTYVLDKEVPRDTHMEFRATLLQD
jgi:hypothetical protein